MKQIELYPHWRTSPASLIIDEIGHEAFGNLVQPTAEYYKSVLSLPAVLEYYEAGEFNQDADSAYVTCKLATHGGEDRHASARYFRLNRETGEFDPAFYCYKCQKSYSSFWFTFYMEKDWHGRSLRDTIKFIDSDFHIPPPLELWFNYDASTYYAEDGGKIIEDPTLAFVAAEKVLELKDSDVPLYLKNLKRIMLGHK
jgi:hypothetical protein